MSNPPLWTVVELLSATLGKLAGDVKVALNGVSIDSRTVGNGDIFVAIKGDLHDGHDHVASALRAGAGLAIVSKVTDEMRSAGPLIVVDEDPLRSLEKMAFAARERSRARIVAVTGSVGKTSTKELLRLALGASGEVHASVASFNNHWGVPLTLARLHPHAAYGIFEIGMNHAGEITPLVAMVRPHVVIITNIAPVHLGQFKSLDDIAMAKAEIFSGLEPGATAILNHDNEYFSKLKTLATRGGARDVIGFGHHVNADVRIKALSMHDSFSCISANVCGVEVAFKLGIPGAHMALNCMGVLGAVHAVGADLARATLALGDARPAKGRGEQQRLNIPGGSFLLLDESYNANPESVRAALALLGQIKPGRSGRRIAVLGDMLELGESAAKLHADVSTDLVAHHIDLLFAAGPLMSHLWNQTPLAKRAAYATSANELTRDLLKAVRAGDVVMIKGSNGSRMGPLAEALRHAFEPEKRISD